jgi:Protein of unknown function (DUF2442)
MTKLKYPEWIETQLTELPQEISLQSQALEAMRAVSAKYDARKKLIHVALQNGASFSFPPHLAQGLQNASTLQLSNVEVSPMGTGLSWPLLDADLSVEGLLGGVFGSRAWMRAHAAKAGSARSEAKANAARVNGARGGRPRKVAPTSAQGA